MTDHTAMKSDIYSSDPTENAAADCLQMLKYGIRERDAVAIILTAIVSGLLLGYYVERGVKLVVPIVAGLGLVLLLIFLSVTAVWNFIQSPPTIPPEVPLVAIGGIVLISLLAVVGFYAERHGWMEVENDGPF